jgi:hypothetical protein
MKTGIAFWMREFCWTQYRRVGVAVPKEKLRDGSLLSTENGARLHLARPPQAVKPGFTKAPRHDTIYVKAQRKRKVRWRPPDSFKLPSNSGVFAFLDAGLSKLGQKGECERVANVLYWMSRETPRLLLVAESPAGEIKRLRKGEPCVQEIAAPLW